MDLAVLIRQLQGGPWHEVGEPGEPAFGTGFSNYGGGYATAAFRGRGGSLHLKGSVQNASAVANTDPIFTLDEEWWPDEILSFAVPANGAFGSLQIDTNGEVTLAVGDTSYIALDGVSFPVG